MTAITYLGGEPLTLAGLRTLEAADGELALHPQSRERMQRSAECLQRAIGRDELIYGVNTGSGPLAGAAIATDQITTLQSRMLLSNAVGVGEPLPEIVVRRAMILKVVTLAQGLSGVRPELADALISLLNARIHPVVPSQGSCGASGDLAPLAHIGITLLGIGEVSHVGERVNAAAALAAIGLTPLSPGPKEGLALVNGTQISTALAIEGLFQAEACLTGGLCAAALSLEAGAGNAAAYDARIHAWRNQSGQQHVAASLRALLAGSPLQEAPAKRVQDPYCLRCIPQVMGSALDQLRRSALTLECEINGVTDNPLVDADTDSILYGGNFHAQPIGLAADSQALAIAELGSMAERRIAFLVDGHMSGLPDFLAGSGGLNSGFMVAQVTAAALASENKQRAAPASTDSIPTAANQEDYVSMATYAAHRLLAMTANLRAILAIELIAACQGLDQRQTEASSDQLEAVKALVRRHVSRLDNDRFMAPDVEAVTALIAADSFGSLVSDDVEVEP